MNKNIIPILALIILLSGSQVNASTITPLVLDVSAKKTLPNNPVLIQWSAPADSVCTLNDKSVSNNAMYRQQNYLIESLTSDKKFTLACTIGTSTVKISKKVNVKDEPKNSPAMAVSYSNLVATNGLGNKYPGVEADLNWYSTNTESCFLYQFFNNFRTVNFLEATSTIATQGTQDISASSAVFGGQTERTYFISCERKTGLSVGAKVVLNSQATK